MVRHRAILPRFRDAGRGLWQTYAEEPNFRFHLFAASGVAVAAIAVGVEAWEAAYLAITVAMVLLAELVNTAVERTVDFAAGGRRHPLAGQAKEIAAGAVLLTAGHAAFAALLVFVVNHGFMETVMAALARPWLLAVPVLFGVVGLMVGRTERE